jgi:hypothetical protein
MNPFNLIGSIQYCRSNRMFPQHEKEIMGYKNVDDVLKNGCR